ncbi:hypothetical protein AB0C01_14280 [Micromonospora sp. NPDC048905]
MVIASAPDGPIVLPEGRAAWSGSRAIAQYDDQAREGGDRL